VQQSGGTGGGGAGASPAGTSGTAGTVIQEVEVEEQDEMVFYSYTLNRRFRRIQVLLLLEHQDQQIFLQDQEQTQLQHYRHQLEVVKLRHSRFLEHLQLANNSST
jgi:hypothetical protein